MGIGGCQKTRVVGLALMQISSRISNKFLISKCVISISIRIKKITFVKNHLINQKLNIHHSHYIVNVISPLMPIIPPITQKELEHGKKTKQNKKTELTSKKIYLLALVM